MIPLATNQNLGKGCGIYRLSQNCTGLRFMRKARQGAHSRVYVILAVTTATDGGSVGVAGGMGRKTSNMG
jgi:hypothetical protein